MEKGTLCTYYAEAFGQEEARDYLAAKPVAGKKVAAVVKRPDNDMAAAVMRKASTRKGRKACMTGSRPGRKAPSSMEQVGEAGVSLVKAVYASNNEIARLSREKETRTLQKDIRDLGQELRPVQ